MPASSVALWPEGHGGSLFLGLAPPDLARFSVHARLVTLVALALALADRQARVAA